MAIRVCNSFCKFKPLNSYHEIKLNNDDKVINAKPYRTSISQKTEITKHVNKMLIEKIIER